jgi:hypothetical protein
MEHSVRTKEMSVLKLKIANLSGTRGRCSPPKLSQIVASGVIFSSVH